MAAARKSIELQLFQEASELLGDPIGDWEFVGIEFNDLQPHLRYYPEDGRVSISLSLKAKDSDEQYLFQLAHELCHLFYPKKEYPSLKEYNTLVINEGVSTYFSIKTTGYHFNSADEIKSSLKLHYTNYYDAFVLVEQLLFIDPLSIKKLRIHQPRIDLLTTNDFKLANINVSNLLIKSLLKQFN